MEGIRTLQISMQNVESEELIDVWRLDPEPRYKENNAIPFEETWQDGKVYLQSSDRYKVKTE